MRILFVDFSTKLKTVHDLDRSARGGMVTSLFQVPDALSQLGHDVIVHSDIENPGMTDSGTLWAGYNRPPPLAYDVLVCNRGIGRGYQEINARHRILWTHDLPHNGFALEPRMFAAFSRVVFMSGYAERVWRAFFPQIGKSATIPNGVDKGLFRPREKNLGQLIYISAPNRGLAKLPLIFEAACNRTRRPLMLDAYSNLAVLHPNESGDNALPREECERVGIRLRDPIPQKDLAVELGEAGLMVMPSGYPEICSNAVLQALACGTPVVTTGGLGATPEWVRNGHNGLLTRFRPEDYMVYDQEVVRAIVTVMRDEKFHRRLIRGAEKTRVLTWEEVGRQWHKMLTRLS